MRRARAPRVVLSVPMRASAAALALYAGIMRMEEPTPLDLAIYDWARQTYRRPIELAQLPLELIGLPGVYIPLALLVARQLRRRGQGGGRRIIESAVAGWLAVRLMRVLLHRPRPPRPPGRRPKHESTFPSGHTTGATALAIGAASVLFDEQMINAAQALVLGLGMPVLVAANRVYVREHWLTDVLGGLALGTSVGLSVVHRRLSPRGARATRDLRFRFGANGLWRKVS
jgi:membrane-associated phospholipid phosphatase